MAEVGKLSALRVAKLAKVGLYNDGAGLYLQVTGPAARSWIFKFQRGGRVRMMGLGPLHTVALAEAREAALECRKMLREGIDPIEARKTKQGQAKLDAARSVTFKQCAEGYVAAHAEGWKSAKHRKQWETTLAMYAYPTFGDLPVQLVDVALVMKVLEPIWKTKTETASRLRGRIEGVLNWAKTRGHRSGENPAAWKGHLENLLPARSKVKRIRHHAALPYAEIGAFMAELRAEDALTARALEFAILTAARIGEVLGAHWGEIDLHGKIWTIPGVRMKGGKDHRVPLSPAALPIIEKMAKARIGDFIFPGFKAKRPLSDTAIRLLLHRMGHVHATTHGFRSSFRDWCAEQTAFPREVAEMALAHAIDNQVEAAYRRGDLFEKRRKLMDAWSNYCGTIAKAGAVVPLHKATA
jgi:integrase